MDYTEKYLELLRGHLLNVNKELISWEEVYESNERSINNGDALITEIALASHSMMKESIEAKKEYYYDIEGKIDKIQKLLNNTNDNNI